MTAIMAPGSRSAASPMRPPRVATSDSASSRSRAPAATRALNSPRLWPATKAGRYRRAPSSSAAARQARDAARIAGWALAVARRGASAPWGRRAPLALPARLLGEPPQMAVRVRAAPELVQPLAAERAVGRVPPDGGGDGGR